MNSWLRSPGHTDWLLDEAHRLFAFYQYAAADPAGGFFDLDRDGRPTPEPTRRLVSSARMVYCFSLGHLLGRPGAAVLADHGIRFLTEAHRDEQNGGYFWTVGHEGPLDRSKQAYGDAHVLLAAAAAVLAERPGAEGLLADVARNVDEHFWSEEDGLLVEEFGEDWTGPSEYRGANSNMHMVEALLAAADATGDHLYRKRALRISERLIHECTAANVWRVAEHYTTTWDIDRDYNRDSPANDFRPYGSIVGHWFEWSRLLLQVRAALSSEEGWLLDAAIRLFRKGVEEGWDARVGGLLYTVDFDGRPLNRDRWWWTIAEAIGAAAYLAETTGEAFYERWYRTFWDFADSFLIDHDRGGWHHVLDHDNRPKHEPYARGKKIDLYHSLHACLLPLLPKDESPALALAHGRWAR